MRLIKSQNMPHSSLGESPNHPFNDHKSLALMKHHKDIQREIIKYLKYI